jgi:hypothetical protein
MTEDIAWFVGACLIAKTLSDALMCVRTAPRGQK